MHEHDEDTDAAAESALLHFSSSRDQHDQDVRRPRLPLAGFHEGSTTSRTLSAVTAAKSAPGSSRMASSRAVHEVGPVSSAATIE
ncbi:hypothetical protein ACIGQE_21830 [Streptomyces sp. NPDC053429]|uniref:hypothetical protein n=1 Tax=Streptomyces sp. NPDC053429 TaxID=3365702 RepID=UPI0037D6CBFC